MPSKIPVRVRHSLAFRLTLWYGGIFTLSAGVTFLFFYLLITNLFSGYTDHELAGKAGEFTAILDAGGIEAVKQTAWREAQAAGEKKVFIRLLSRKGRNG